MTKEKFKDLIEAPALHSREEGDITLQSYINGIIASAVNSLQEELSSTAMQGWQCPICKRVYSPSTQMCQYCGNIEIQTTTRPEVFNTP